MYGYRWAPVSETNRFYVSLVSQMIIDCTYGIPASFLPMLSWYNLAPSFWKSTNIMNTVYDIMMTPTTHGSHQVRVRVQVRGSKRFDCHAGHQEVSRCRTRGECEEFSAHRQQSMQVRGSTLSLKPRADITRSRKLAISGPTKKSDVL